MKPVVVYRTAWCPYCQRAEALLAARGVAAPQLIDLDDEPGRRNEMIERSGRSTVPQIFIGDVHVGGYDDLHALDLRGELGSLLQS